jgi:hypothetical protein
MSESSPNSLPDKTKWQRAIEESWRCKYVLPQEPSDAETSAKTKYSCPHQRDEQYHYGPLCIFHLPKPTDEEQKHLNASELDEAKGIQNKFTKGIWSLMADAQSRDTPVLDFRGFIFPQMSLNHGFRASADFSHAVFSHDIDFSFEDFIEYETFGGLIFSNGVKFCHARFLGEAVFSNVNFHGDADFGNTTFEKAAQFNGAVFDRVSNFDKACFNDTVNFSAQFKQAGNFAYSSYSRKADFTQSEFDAGASFFNAGFKAEAYFDNVVFGKVMDSSPANKVSQDELEDYVYTQFTGARFSDKVSFEDAFFDGDVYFDNASFDKEARFISDRTWVFGRDCHFTRVSLHKDSELVFFRVDLSRARFHDTNLESVSFRDVKWAGAQTRLGKLLRGRAYILWDEIRPLEGMRDWLDDAKTAENYRQLVLNYEGKRDYESAEYFHIGEMEMRRRSVSARSEEALFQPRWWLNLRQYINGHGLYWLSSRYGTSYTQALGVLLVMVLYFSLLFLYAGFQRVREGGDNPIYAIEYNVLPDSAHHLVSVSQWASDFGESISFTLSILTFQRDRFYQPLNARSRFVLYLSVFLLAAQAALTLLAIRRRFRR